MNEITLAQLQPYLNSPVLKSWKLRECSMCEQPLYYLIRNGEVFYDSNCDCTRYRTEPQPRTQEDLLKQFNMQTHPGVRERMWKSFTDAMGTPTPQGQRMPTNEEHKLVEILVQMVLASTADPVFCAKPQDEKGKWIAETLRGVGYENEPVGSSYVYLTGVRT